MLFSQLLKQDPSVVINLGAIAIHPFHNSTQQLSAFWNVRTPWQPYVTDLGNPCCIPCLHNSQKLHTTFTFHVSISQPRSNLETKCTHTPSATAGERYQSVTATPDRVSFIDKVNCNGQQMHGAPTNFNWLCLVKTGLDRNTDSCWLKTNRHSAYLATVMRVSSCNDGPRNSTADGKGLNGHVKRQVSYVHCPHTVKKDGSFDLKYVVYNWGRLRQLS